MHKGGIRYNEHPKNKNFQGGGHIRNYELAPGIHNRMYKYRRVLFLRNVVIEKDIFSLKKLLK